MTDPVDAALADLALSAVNRLHIEMGTARASKDRIAAANSILDRLGYGRTTRAQADVADQEIKRALQSVAKEIDEETEARQIEEAKRAAKEMQEEQNQKPSPEPSPEAIIIATGREGLTDDWDDGAETDAWLNA